MLINHSSFKDIVIKTPQQIVDVLRKTRIGLHPFELDKEYLYVLGLTRMNKIKYIDLVSIGSIAGTVAEPREIFRMAIHKGVGGGIVLSHNHPSGNIKPSDNDKRLTRKIKEAGILLDIPLIDHIIFTEKECYSFTNDEFI